MTTIHVHDTYGGSRGILEAPIERREELLRAMYEPAIGMYAHMPQPVDVPTVHRFGSGFPLDRREARSLEGLERLKDARAWARIETALDRGLSALREARPEATFPEELHVLLVLDDPDDEHLMTVNQGYTAMGGISGYIHIGIWPTDANLQRLEGIAVHELHHNVRYTNVVWNPATVTVGEQVVSEGLADAFARELYGELGLTLIGLPVRGDRAVFDKVVSGLDVAGMQNLAPWVHGDATAARFGAAPVGVPTGAGYAVGLELVERYTAATGVSATQAVLVPSREVIEVALR